MFGLMIWIRRDELRCGNRRRRAFRHFVGIMDILDYARPRQHETGLDGPDLIEDIMGKPRKEQPEAESIFANNPFIEGLFEWMDSPEGQQSIAVRDVLWDLLEGVQVDAKQRQLIWPGAKRTARKERLDLDQSVQRIQKMCPEFPGGEIEEFLLDWIVWAMIRKTTPRPSLTNSTSSLSGGLPTIAERQKPQKNRRELVTLEYSGLSLHHVLAWFRPGWG